MCGKIYIDNHIITSSSIFSFYINNIIKISDKIITKLITKDEEQRIDMEVIKESSNISFSIIFNLNNELTHVVFNRHKHDISQNGTRISSNLKNLLSFLYFNSTEGKHKLETVTCKDKLCPICRSKMKESINSFKQEEMECNNGCYKTRKTIFPSLSKADQRFDIIVVTLLSEKGPVVIRIMDESTTDKVLSKIDYWKENDRYLMKLLLS